MIRTINNVVRSLLFLARLPPEYWVEALLTAAYLLNILPSTSINNDIPYTKVFNKPTSYTHLHPFGCLCYPYTFPPHQLAPHTTPSIFLGYPYNHHGYRCLELNTNKIIISRHVTFDETVFPFGSMTFTQPPSYQFLDDNLDTSPIALRLLTTPTSHQQTSPQTTPQTTSQATPQTTPLTPLPTPTPLNTMLPPNTPPPHTSPPPPPPSTSQHPMVTCFKVGIVKANLKYNFHVTTSSPIPKSLFHALRDPNWKQAMCDEYKALINNKTWGQFYMHQPSGFTDSAHSDYVFLLQKSLYGLKQASRVWFQRFSSYAIRAGFYHSKTDSSLFIFHKGPDTAYLLLYVDDIILTASYTSFLQRIISSLHAEFAMTDLGPPNYFLGISATRTTSGIFLCQTKYATEILEQAHMLNCNPCRTPVDTEKKLGPEGSPVTDPTLYRSLAGALQYLIFTRPDLSYAVQQLCLYMHDPREPHINAMKCCPATHRSTSGYCVFLGDNLLTWSSKHHDTLSRSIDETEYRAVSNIVAETSWIRNLLRELQTPLFTVTLVYCDNVSVVYMSANAMQHQCSKHIEIDIHFVRDKVTADVNHINFFDVEYPELVNDDEGVANDLNKGKSDSSSSSVSGSNLNTAEFPIDFGNDADSSDGFVATQNEEAPRQWNAKLTSTLIENEFGQSKSDYSLYTKSDKGVFLALLVYVDDIIITVVDTDYDICLNQRKYVLDLLSEYGMLACKTAKTPLMSKHVISNEAFENVTDYQKLIGKLIYLTNTTPDISYVVYCLIHFMHSPLSSHLKIAFKIQDILRAVQAQCMVIRKSVTSISTIKIAANPVFHERTKHLEIDFHFVRENILNGVIKTVKVDSAHQIADILTKGLDTIQHYELVKKTCNTFSLNHVSIFTWDDLVNKFVNQFFLPSKTTHLKNEISRFTQRFEETFGEAWERFKEMVRACPHNGFSDLTQIDTFYNGLNEQDQDSLNAVAGGNLLSKTTREALKIIENKSKVRYSRCKSNVSRVNTNSRESSSKTDDRIDKLADQISNLVEIVSKQVITPATVKAIEKSCVICGGAHAYYDCIATDSNQSSVCAATMERETEEATDKEQPNGQGSTAHIQPLVVPTPILEPDVLKTQPKPNIPYPSRLNDQKLHEKATNQIEKFFQIFHDLHFDISFADALLLMPKFSTTIKSLLTNKGKLFKLAKLSLPELTLTRMTLELADRSITHPKGVAEDVFIKVGKFHFPTDFVVVDFEADPRVPLILGRSFLRTGRALIDVYGEEITLRTKSEFCKEPIVKSSSPTLTPFGESDFVLEEIEDFHKDESIPMGIEDSCYDPEGDIIYLEKLLNDDPSQFPSMDLKQVEETKAKSSIEEPLEFELKELPSHLEYAFLEETDKLPVIIAKDLKDDEKEALLKVLKSHKRAIA
uniref:Ribonuclease H-like domain-containing protein n=1 Tax=Tanacetum cinerariifolium TaxID=118510 RepID=A0A6L2MMG6_TANCI|nr:ribonuclease H-like domain-containing protein [Tanacetum cinerariifolium]